MADILWLETYRQRALRNPSEALQKSGWADRMRGVSDDVPDGAQVINLPLVRSEHGQPARSNVPDVMRLPNPFIVGQIDPHVSCD